MQIVSVGDNLHEIANPFFLETKKKKINIKTGFDFSCTLSAMYTISMKCQILFSCNNEKNITIRRVLK